MPPSGAAVKRLFREINELRKNPPEGIRIQTNEEDMLDVTGIIQGPEGTPYAGGYFNVRFKFTEEFPAAPPKCWFSTKLFHPNVGPAGEICVNTLKKDWQSTYGIGHILVTIKCLLIYPNPESALDEEAGKMLMEDYESFCERARLITSVHATPRRRPAEFDVPSKVEEEEKAKNEAKESNASSSKVAPAPPSTTGTSSKPPSMSRKASPGPSLSLKSSLSSSDKEGSSSSLSGLAAKEKAASSERHPSPAPLSTADANVEAKAKLASSGLGLGLGMAAGASSGAVGGTAAGASSGGAKSMKRAATNTVVSGAEKRKKALKRL